MSDNLFGFIAPMLMMSGIEMSKMFTMVVVMLASFLIKHFTETKHGVKMVRKIVGVFWPVKTKAYILKARISFKHNIVFDSDVSHEFKAIQKTLYSTITSDTETRIDYTIDEHRIDGETTRFVCMDTKYEVEDDIMIKQDVTKENSEKEDYTYLTYTFEISSKKGVFVNVLNFMDKIAREYEEAQISQIDQKIWVLDHFDRSETFPFYTPVPFTSTKSFENMFFEGKEALIKSIDSFEGGLSIYENLGVPHTLGMFFHGKHGTGKTSCAKAIANYTGRHVILASLSKIKTAKQFANLFMYEFVNGVKIPIKNRLYVFDDFDCSSWKDVIKTRNGSVAATPASHSASASNDVIKLALALSKNTNKSKKRSNDDTDDDVLDVSPITLGDVLEIMDGFIEMAGRMMIFISNHPENIDPAILRCGRIDTNIEFKNMRRVDVADMYKLWFGSEMPQSKMRDYAFSQADLGNLFKTHDLEKINKTLA